MPLDPHMKAILDQAAAAGGGALSDLGVQGVREAIRRGTSSNKRETVAQITDRRIAGPAGEIPVRIYRPDEATILPATVFFHGGGWVAGDLDTHDVICRILANAARCVVVSVDYRLAPEHRFPAGPEDCYTATKWVANNAAAIGADAMHLAVAGTSAGGTLAAAVAMMARDRGGPSIGCQVLWYPATDAAMDTPSHREYASGSYYLLSRADMEWFWNCYLSSERDRANPYCCPGVAKDLRGLPSALIVTAEYDPLRDEAEEFAARLRRAAVETKCTRYEGVTHAFTGMASVLEKGRQSIFEAADVLRSAFA